MMGRRAWRVICGRELCGAPIAKEKFHFLPTGQNLRELVSILHQLLSIHQMGPYDIAMLKSYTRIICNLPGLLRLEMQSAHLKIARGSLTVMK